MLEMTVSDQIKLLCVRYKITQAELARRLGKSTQNFSQKMKRGSFTVDEMKEIASTLGCTYVGYFDLPDGSKIEY